MCLSGHAILYGLKTMCLSGHATLYDLKTMCLSGHAILYGLEPYVPLRTRYSPGHSKTCASQDTML
jgi:hypothetical protein